MKGLDAQFKIDACVYLDTNAMSYIRSYFYKNKIEFEPLIKFLLRKDVNFDASLYMLENGKCKDSQIKYVFENLMAYEKLKEIGRENTFVDDSNRVIEFSELAVGTDELFSIMRKFENTYLIELQLLIYVLLLEVAILSFKYRKNQVMERRRELFNFIDTGICVFLEREVMISSLLLGDENDFRIFKFFKSIRKGTKDLKQKIKAMAWDLTHIRSLEYFSSRKITEEADFSIYTLISYDEGLKEIMKNFGYDRVLYCDELYGGYTLPFSMFLTREERDLYFSQEAVENRSKKNKSVDIEK